MQSQSGSIQLIVHRHKDAERKAKANAGGAGAKVPRNSKNRNKCSVFSGEPPEELNGVHAGVKQTEMVEH